MHRLVVRRFWSSAGDGAPFVLRRLEPAKSTLATTVPISQLSKVEILKRFPSLLNRDLELSNRRISEVLVRPNVFFLKLEYLRVLVSREEVLVFDDTPLMEEFSASLAKEFLTASEKRPPEYLVLKHALKTTTRVFQDRFALLDPLARRLLKSLITAVDEESPLQLIPLKSAISRFHTSLFAFNRAFERGSLPDGLQLGAQDDADVTEDLTILLADYSTRAEEIMNELEDL